MTPLTESVIEGNSQSTSHWAILRLLCKRRKGLKVCHINAQSLCKKIDEFKFYFENSLIDIVCISETWFTSHMCDELFAVKGYTIYRHDRQGHGGGVAIFVRESLKCFVKSKSSVDFCVEYLFVEIVCNNRKVLVGTVYRPNKNVDCFPLANTIEKLSLSYEDIIVAGDFNCNLLVEHCVTDIMSTFGLLPVNSVTPTHFTNSSVSLIDHFYTNNLRRILLYDQLSMPSFSKHDLIFLTFDFCVTTTNDIQHFSFRDFKNIDYVKLNNDLNKIDWHWVKNMISPDDQMQYLQKNLVNLFNTHVPIKTMIKRNYDNIWFNSKIKKAIERRNKMYDRWKRYKTSDFHNQFLVMRKEVSRMVKNAKSKFFENSFARAIGSKQTWQKIKSIGLVKSKAKNCQSLIDLDSINEKFVNIPAPQVTNTNINLSCPLPKDQKFSFSCVDQTDVLECFLSIKSNATGIDGIHPIFLKAVLPILLPYITHCFNMILTTSVFPKCWKTAKILPIPKADGELRPIAILPYLSKVFELVMHRQLSAFLSKNSLLHKRQSGFRKGHNCTTALIDVIEDIRESIDEGKVTFLTLLDYSKAFDSVNHSILLAKLDKFFGLSPTSTQLIASFLRNRSQAVCSGQLTSSVLELHRGVPQGSILGPLLFSLYINDLPAICTEMRSHLYADDVQIYRSCKFNDINDCALKINQNLSHINKWASDNALTLNPKKSQVLVISRKQLDTSNFPKILLGGIAINYMHTAKNLGIIFNQRLTWDSHINLVVGKLYGMLRALWTTQHFTPLRIRILIIKTYVMPSLLYGCEIFVNCGYACKHKLNVLFNNITRYVFGIKARDHVSHLADTIYSMPLDKLLQFRSLLLLHKIYYSKVPGYLALRITATKSVRNSKLLAVRYKTLTSERQFLVHVTRLWNSLPQNLVSISNMNTFRRELRKYFSTKK